MIPRLCTSCVICTLTRERNINNVAELEVNLPFLSMCIFSFFSSYYFLMCIFFTFVNLKFESIHLPVHGTNSIHPRSPEIWVFNQTRSHILLKNTLKFNYDSLIITSKNHFWLLVKIAFLHEDSVSARRVLHAWELHNNVVHDGDNGIC